MVTAMAASDKQAAANNPGLVEDVDPATKPYIMQQTVSEGQALGHSITENQCPSLPKLRHCLRRH